MVELLSPVQDFVSLVAAINAGADSVYFGIKKFNMRVTAKNFALIDLKKVINLCHKNNVKAYLTLNSILYDNELNKLKKILTKVKKLKIDAVIASDFSVIDLANKLNIPIHLSTQMSISNFSAIKSLKKKYKNIKSIILARELTLKQIKTIIKKLKQNKINIKIETFIHGAMCVSVSGRCFLSKDLFNKSANRGKCIQPCRRQYKIIDIEEGHEYEVGNNYIISPKDLCTIEIFDKLKKSGIDIFKIEGRNKSPEYVKTVTNCYRYAIDNKLTKSKKNELVNQLKTVYNRGFSTGFYMGKPINAWSNSYGSSATKKKIYIGIVKNFYKKLMVAELKIESYGLKNNDIICFQGNKTGVIEQNVTSMQQNKKTIKTLKKGFVGLKVKKIVRQNDKVYIIK
jgi:U32 family peptidase